jgi:hypothetical protein
MSRLYSSFRSGLFATDSPAAARSRETLRGVKMSAANNKHRRSFMTTEPSKVGERIRLSGETRIIADIAKIGKFFRCPETREIARKRGRRTVAWIQSRPKPVKERRACVFSAVAAGISSTDFAAVGLPQRLRHLRNATQRPLFPRHRRPRANSLLPEMLNDLVFR